MTRAGLAGRVGLGYRSKLAGNLSHPWLAGTRAQSRTGIEPKDLVQSVTGKVDGRRYGAG